MPGLLAGGDEDGAVSPRAVNAAVSQVAMNTPEAQSGSSVRRMVRCAMPTAGKRCENNATHEIYVSRNQVWYPVCEKCRVNVFAPVRKIAAPKRPKLSGPAREAKTMSKTKNDRTPNACAGFAPATGSALILRVCKTHNLAHEAKTCPLCRTDTERLDWMEQNGCGVNYNVECSAWGVDHDAPYALTMRAAIDAAIDAPNNAKGRKLKAAG